MTYVRADGVLRVAKAQINHTTTTATTVATTTSTPTPHTSLPSLPPSTSDLGIIFFTPYFTYPSLTPFRRTQDATIPLKSTLLLHLRPVD